MPRQKAIRNLPKLGCVCLVGGRKEKKSNSHRREPIGDSLSTEGLIPRSVALKMGVMYKGVLKTSMNLTKAVPGFSK